MEMNISYFFVVFLHGAESAVKEARLEQLPTFPAGSVNALSRAVLDGFHDERNCKRMRGIEASMPVVREKDPGGQQETMFLSSFADDLCQTGEFRWGEIPPPG